MWPLQQITMLIVTRDEFARDVSHRVMMLDGGKIIKAPIPEIFTNPSHERTQQFLSAVLRDA